MKKRIAGYCLLAALSSAIAWGQKPKLAQKIDDFLHVKFATGFAVLNNGDTLSGKFEFNDSQQNYRLLVHLDTISYSKKAFMPDEVAYFALNKNLYAPHPSKADGLVFMRVLLQDSLKIYQHKHFYSSYTGGDFLNEFYCVKPTGQELVVSSASDFPFIASTTRFFSDYPGLCYSIRKKKYGIKDLYKIGLIYNDWLRKRTPGGIDQ